MWSIWSLIILNINPRRLFASKACYDMGFMCVPSRYIIRIVHILEPIHHFCKCMVYFRKPRDSYNMEFQQLSMLGQEYFQELWRFQNHQFLLSHSMSKRYLMILYLDAGSSYDVCIVEQILFEETNSESVFQENIMVSCWRYPFASWCGMKDLPLIIIVMISTFTILHNDYQYPLLYETVYISNNIRMPQTF